MEAGLLDHIAELHQQYTKLSKDGQVVYFSEEYAMLSPVCFFAVFHPNDISEDYKKNSPSPWRYTAEHKGVVFCCATRKQMKLQEENI
jgi:hypothetical protein